MATPPKNRKIPPKEAVQKEPAPANVPEREAWIYENPEVLAMIRAGLAEAAAGLATEGEDYSHYADLDIDDE